MDKRFFLFLLVASALCFFAVEIAASKWIVFNASNEHWTQKLHDMQSVLNLPEGDTEQKPKYAPFCMKGATTHTSLHQIGPKLALNWCWLYKLPYHVLNLDK